jgi:hypothetical protein
LLPPGAGTFPRESLGYFGQREIARSCRFYRYRAVDRRQRPFSNFNIRRDGHANTVRLHRVLATRPEKVYRAFLEADALAKWLPPNGLP